MNDHELLGSWKEIADYLGKEIHTCWRWEKELGLPVHRIDSQSSRSRVFAYRSEIDQWLRERANGHESQPASRRIRPRALAGILVAIVAVVAVLAIWRLGLRRPAGSSLSERLVTIAVFPFSDADGPAHQAYYAEGIMQEIIKSLRMYDSLAVIPIPLNLRPAGGSSDKPEIIGRELGLDYILKGTLRRDRDGISLAAEFLKAKDETRLWNSRYPEPLRNLLTVTDDIQSRICQTLKIKKRRIAPGSLEPADAGGLTSLENYIKANFVSSHLESQSNDPWLLYHQGRFYSGQSTMADNELAISLFQQALALEPQYAEACVGLANCYTDYVSFNWDFDIQWLDKARELLNKAQALSPGLPEYYSSLLKVALLREFIFNEDHEPEIQSLAREGLGRYPNDQKLNSIVGVYYFRKFGREGRQADMDHALAYKKKAFWLNPYDFNNIVYAELLLMNRDFDAAIDVCLLAEKLDASLSVRFFLGQVYYYRGELDRSRSLFLTFETLPRLRLLSRYFLALIEAQQGRPAEAEKMIQQISLLSPGDYRFFNDALYLASVYFGLKKTELGYRYLREFMKKEQKAKEKYFNWRYIDLDGNFDRVKNDPKFLEILNIKADPPWAKQERSK
jgi:TolB-like protein